MELRHIRYFLAVAEEENFTRAAARLGIGQPPLSLQIRDLEREVGVQLFHRVPHGAELTEAGRSFLAAVKGLPGAAEQAKQAARRAAGGMTGQLSLGYSGSVALNPLFPAAIRAFRRDYPEVELTFFEINSVGLIARLVDGSLDVGLVRPSSADPDSLDIRPLMTERLVAAVPSSHAAASAKQPVKLMALKDDAFILTPRAIGVSLHDTTLAACRAAGFEPVLGQPAPQIATILSLIAAETGVALVPETMRQFNIRGVAFLDVIAPAPAQLLAVAHRRAQPSATAQNFARLIRKIAAGRKAE
ncbi:LysR family transcriptional regulator [Martelella sp. HB161492]|uniref:LysR family transcriptional regulator n=1 Tax=Martelella sp. HB161492 TaxID=2720726 RepID=UPI00159281E8|nr:LysR family transcriptional regulator [Martelella sp. HB161492]